MDDKGDGTDALFTGDAMMVSPTRSTLTTIVPAHPSMLRPVTIMQLYNGFLEDIERYPILIEGEPVSSVILIGTVSHSTIRMGHWSFKPRDATGVINISYWLETPADSKLAWSTRYSLYKAHIMLHYNTNIKLKKVPPMCASNGDYVQVFGKTGMNEYFLQVKAFKIRSIVNYNDTTHHYLHSIYVTLDIRKKNAIKARSKPVLSASTVFPKGVPIKPSEVPIEMSTKDSPYYATRHTSNWH